jgi:hypothetical protein
VVLEVPGSALQARLHGFMPNLQRIEAFLASDPLDRTGSTSATRMERILSARVQERPLDAQNPPVFVGVWRKNPR